MRERERERNSCLLNYCRIFGRNIRGMYFTVEKKIEQDVPSTWRYLETRRSL